MTIRGIVGKMKKNVSWEEVENLIRLREEQFYNQGFDDGFKRAKIHYQMKRGKILGK